MRNVLAVKCHILVNILPNKGVCGKIFPAVNWADPKAQNI